jgi:hypothetical protein
MGPALLTGALLKVLLFDRALLFAPASDRKMQLVIMRIVAVMIRQFDVDLRMRILMFPSGRSVLPPDDSRQSSQSESSFGKIWSCRRRGNTQ